MKSRKVFLELIQRSSIKKKSKNTLLQLQTNRRLHLAISSQKRENSDFSQSFSFLIKDDILMLQKSVFFLYCKYLFVQNEMERKLGLLYLGRMEEEKGFDLILNAMRKYN